MIRQILCAECGIPKGIKLNSTLEDLRTISFSPPLYSKYVSGRALRHYCCDLCNRMIEPGEECKCVSTFGSPEEYREWEEHYLFVRDT